MKQQFIDTLNNLPIISERSINTENGINIDSSLNALYSSKQNNLNIDNTTGDTAKFLNKRGNWESGSTGSIGPTGPRGSNGPQGYCGPLGNTGNRGGTGVQGETGPQGFCGPRGLTGYCGPLGSKGNTGFCGPQGPKGFCGPKGARGPCGPMGNRGIDSTNRGNTGSKGDNGPKGFCGPKGPVGYCGPLGNKGGTGFCGPKGVIGFCGPRGSQGNSGIKGFCGPRGPANAVDFRVREGNNINWGTSDYYTCAAMGGSNCPASYYIVWITATIMNTGSSAVIATTYIKATNDGNKYASMAVHLPINCSTTVCMVTTIFVSANTTKNSFFYMDLSASTTITIKVNSITYKLQT